MKKKLLVLATALCLTAAVSGTLAYFTDEDVAHNVITTGGIDIEIIETQVDKESGTEVPYPSDPISGVMPGESISKIVTVKNLTGSGDAWIRVTVNTVGQFADGTAIMPTQLRQVVTFEYNNTYWLYDDEDGCYYYRETVGAEELTAPLFKEVKFSPDMSNEYQNCTVYIDVAAEAVQTANNPIPDGGDVTDVKGWPGDKGSLDEQPAEPEQPTEIPGV